MTIDHDELAAHMAAMAGDPTRVFDFLASFERELAGVVRRHLRDLGRGDLASDIEEVRGLVIDVAMLLSGAAGSWQPVGALPWNWASRAVRSLVAAAIGHARAEVDLDRLDCQERIAALSAPSGDATGAALSVDVAALARTDQRVALLTEALATAVANPRHRAIHLEYRIQAGLGDPSPSQTVAAQFGVSSANVRQIDRRVRVALAQVVAGNPRFAPLAVVPWLDADEPAAA
ncbi:MAG: hypothetical protein JJU45_12335 [Acidimicrobiia bacterium]|nr:hypothetical protein [Acidimicrobiia bacterium]